VTAAPYELLLDLAEADMLDCAHVGLAELSLWYCDGNRCFVVVLCDETVLAVFDDEGPATRYYADVLQGLRYAQAVA